MRSSCTSLKLKSNSPAKRPNTSPHGSYPLHDEPGPVASDRSEAFLSRRPCCEPPFSAPAVRVSDVSGSVQEDLGRTCLLAQRTSHVAHLAVEFAYTSPKVHSALPYREQGRYRSDKVLHVSIDQSKNSAYTPRSCPDISSQSPSPSPRQRCPSFAGIADPSRCPGCS